MNKTDRRLLLLASIGLAFFIHVYQSLAAAIILILGVTTYIIETIHAKRM